MSGRADYEERREARIDRLNLAANKAGTESNEASKRSHNLVKDIPLGQPNINGTLTGVLKKSRAAMDKAVRLNDKAEYYADRAESAENNTAISSDDPNAPDRLQEKIDSLKTEQEFMKAVNRYYRKKKTCIGFPEMSEANAKALDTKVEKGYSWQNAPYFDYELTSVNQRIKAAEKRLASLARVDAMAAEIIQFDGGEIDSNADENRVIIRFDERQNEEMTAKLKSHGFKWSPSNKGWQRLRNPWALRIAKQIVGMEGTSNE